ncbi:Acyl-protein synthetase, LuxE [Pricia antarctica]|uniref:Acyl-protein synthetase, LuxE n=1 Tax=Pricia antarctica TaxID=641691 RepID=A0A1G6W0X2_9FLAO|nr:acyl transferase [Pricia antarctica]SDD59590.1 Acyl-protein synthetase, LuxE [Pricia antarctica]
MQTDSIFDISTTTDFEKMALAIFRMQYAENPIYREFCGYLDATTANVLQLTDIPFLPIGFFKTMEIISEEKKSEIIFTSSGTTGSITSKHLVSDIGVYEKSFQKAFAHFYGNIEEYCVLALLPSYLEREGSSLIYMVDHLIRKSGHKKSGFYLDDLEGLENQLTQLEAAGTKTLLIGVSFALLDMVEKHPIKLQNTVIMETGGMKGRRKELIREELHQILKSGFGVSYIHSEYGMTELLSQAYSKGNGNFETPPWMKIMVRDTEDPMSYQPVGKTGGMNIIDLANINSCAFVATQDLGKLHKDGTFEILGRFDNSDVRGCNLMVL